MAEQVATDVESVGQQNFEELANTTGNMKVVVTKQGVDDAKDEIIDQ